MYHLKKYGMLFLLFFSFIVVAKNDENKPTVIFPERVRGVITNPGIGIQEFQGEVLPLEDYPKTAVKYARFYWSDLEPSSNEFNFDLIDSILKSTKRSETVEIRFMLLESPEAGSKIPNWLINQGIKGTWLNLNQTFIPDLSDPMLLKYATRLLMAFGKRYDGNPLLSAIDIGLVGSWGEWHTSNFTTIKNIDKKYTQATLNKYVDMHFLAFPKTPKIMQIGGKESLVYALKKGAGWRGDCLGDYFDFSATWSHMNNGYPDAIKEATLVYPIFTSIWKHAPISFEVCHDMEYWADTLHYGNYQIENTFRWALEQHASTINLKSNAIPVRYRSAVDNALLKLGYRIRLKKFSIFPLITKNRQVGIDGVWINEGVAPAYKSYKLAFQIRNHLNEVVQTDIMGDDLKYWVPGEIQTTNLLTLNPELKDGTYTVRVAFLNKKNEAVINLAMEGRMKLEPWYFISEITLKSKQKNRGKE